MRQFRSFADGPDGRRLPATILAGICLFVLLSAGATGAEFGAPQILTHPDPAIAGEEHDFGRAIVVDRDTLAISARTYLAADRWTNEVFIYARQRSDPASWRLSRRLRSDQSGFADALALDGGTLAVTGQRAIHLYERDGAGVWRRQRSVQPRLPGFPGPMALDGNRLAVGLPTPLSTVLIFERHRPARNRWGLTARVKGELTSPAYREAPFFHALDEPASGFGHSVDLSGERLVVGALTPGPCCGKGGPDTNGIFIFARDDRGPMGWKQLHNFAAPGRRDATADDYFKDYFGSLVSLSGPFLLAGEGYDPEGITNRTRMYLYERNHRGPDGWGYRTELRRQRRNDNYHIPEVSDLRGNTAAIVESAYSSLGVRVFERDFPARNRWGLKTHLPMEFGAFDFGVSMVLGPRELVIGGMPANRVLVFPRAPLVDGGFDGGPLAGWTGSRGPLALASPGLEGSGSALEVAVGGSASPFVASNRPAREPLVSLRFALLPNAVDLGRQPVEILRLFAGQPALRLSLEESDSDPMYRAQLEVRRRDGSWRPVGRARLLPDRESVIGIEYRAPTADGAANGFTRFEVNGHLVREARNLALDRMLIGRVVLGLPAGSPETASGSFLVDNFEMHR